MPTPKKPPTDSPPARDVFHALGDPNRRQILEILRQGELPAGDVVARFDISFAAVSQHLSVLLASGLVARRRDGRRQLYSLRPDGLRQVHEWTEGFRDFWEGRLGRLSAYLAEDDAP